MHPTIDEQLQGARWLLESVAADGELPAASANSLSEVMRILQRVEAAWSQLLPFFVEDNATMTVLLESLTPFLAVDRAGALVDESLASEMTGEAGLDVSAAAQHNAELRARLASVISALPATEAGTEARARISTYLRDRILRDPN